MFTAAHPRRMGSVGDWQRLSSFCSLSLDVISVSRGGDTAGSQTAFRTALDAEDGYRGESGTNYDMTFAVKVTDESWLVDREIVNGSPAAC